MEPNTISIEKAGNSQAFVQILHGILDIQILNGIFENILDLTMDNRMHVRESFLSVFVYLPIVFGDKYKKYVKQIVEKVSQSLSEENEKIRNLAIKALKKKYLNFLMIIINFSQKLFLNKQLMKIQF